MKQLQAMQESYEMARHGKVNNHSLYTFEQLEMRQIVEMAAEWAKYRLRKGL